MNFIRNSVDTAATDACNSLAGITSYSDQDVTYVQATNHYYRFFATSTVAPNGLTVVAPDDITPPAPGRWFRQGPPGQSLVDPGRPASLACEEGPSESVTAEVVTTGATGLAPIEEIIDLSAIFPDPTYTEWLGFVAHVESQSQAASVQLQAQLFQEENAGWQLRVWSWPSAATEVLSGEVFRITMLPPGSAPV